MRIALGMCLETVGFLQKAISMIDVAHGFSRYPVGLKLIIGYMFVNLFCHLAPPRNFIGAAISLLLGVGLLKLKNWAREGTLVWIAIGLIIFSLKTLYEMLANRLHNSEWFAFLFIVSLLGIMFSYLKSPEMKELFSVQPSSELSVLTEVESCGQIAKNV
jgi:hypothetical protein